MFSRALVVTMVLWRILLQRASSVQGFQQPMRQRPLIHRALQVSTRSSSTTSVRNALPSSSSSPHTIHSRHSSSTAIASTLESDPVEATVIESSEPADEEHEISYDPASAVLLGELNPSQVQAVTQPLSAITRVVAGPGSGKTRVLTCRIAYLLEQDPTNRVLGVTFTRKAAGEMQNRLQKLLTQQQQAVQAQAAAAASDIQSAPSSYDYDNEENEIVQENVGDAYAEGLGRAMLGTFHSICAKVLRWNGDLLDTLPSVRKDMVGSRNATFLDGSFAIVDQGEQLRILKECLSQVDIDLKDFDLKPFTVLNTISDVKSKIAEGKDPFQSPGNKPLPKALRVTSKVYVPYREKLLSTNCIDFDDLIFMTRELLLEHEEVRDRLQRRWTHILVDEFQDTSRSQMDLIKFLTSSSLFVVGDADQSIYSWRGAHVGSLSDFEHEFEGYLGGVQTVYLMENYRSTSNIVNAAQKVISASSGKASSGADKMRQNMKPKRGSGPTPRVVACKDEKAEADFVVKHVKEMVTSGKFGPENSVAFIYRTNAQSRALEEACVKHNLPYVIFGSATSFYKRQEIKDCLCFLRWMYNGRDRSSMLRAMKTPTRGIGDVAIREFDDYCARVDAYFAATHPDGRRPTPFDVLLSLSSTNKLSEDFPLACDSLAKRPLKLLTVFSQQMRSIRDLAYTKPVAKILALIIESLELVPHFDKLSKSKAEFEERQANVRELRKASDRYTKEGSCLSRDDPNAQDTDEFTQSPLGIFLDDVSLVTDMADNTERSGEERFVASLMTIHASKGMEFDAVFVVGNEDGTFPTSQAINEGDGSVVLEEEKRLCYVAMTRAKTELFMTWRREVNIFTGEGIRTVDKDRSRFLDVLVSSKGKPNASTARSPATSKGGQGTTNVYSALGGLEERRRALASKKASAEKYKYPYARKQATPKPSRPSPPRFEGTGNVYAKQSQSPLERPVQARVDSSAKSKRRSSTETKRPAERPPPPPRKRVTKPAAPRQSMDSTWFFPVGSEVMHDNHGRGIVLPPPAAQEKGQLPVSVKFGNGEQHEFCARGSDLTPIVE